MAFLLPEDFIIQGSGQALVKQGGVVIARLNGLGDMQVSMKYPAKDVYGSGYYPITSVSGDRAINLSFTNNKFNLNYLKVMGSTVATAQSVAMPVFGETATIPSATTYTVTLKKAASAVALSETVRLADGSGTLFERVASGSEATGKYSIASGVLTFAEADKGKAIIVDYDATSTTATVATIKNDDTIPIVEIVHDGKFADPLAGKMRVVTRFYYCKASGDMNLDWKRADAATPKLDFSVLDARVDGVLGYIATDLVA